MSQPRHRRRPAPWAWRGVFSVLAAAVTTVAVMGGLGALPSSATRQQPSAQVLAPAGYDEPVADGGTEASAGTSLAVTPGPALASSLDPAAEEALPADSGRGRRVVFSESRQRVWLVSGGQRVKRTYLVSGSLTDNLQPGAYQVYSRSLHAWGVEDSGTMRWFVRFAHGEHAAIGFHDIPVDGGKRVQSVSQLGTPQSHGCIRQRTSDARALWWFAKLGTRVVVTA